MTNNELFYFTGQCLTLDERPALRSTIYETIYKSQIDWNQFVGLCSNHFILQVIYLKFNSHELLNCIPDELTHHLKFIYRLNHDRNAAILKQLEDITATLNSEKIYPVFMKGAGNLLSGLYRDIGERVIGDIDFLVSDKDFIKSVDILLAMGYERPSTVDLSKKSQKHYPRLFRKDVPADVEIHRLPVESVHSKILNADMIFMDQQCAPTLQGCFVPSEEHKIIQNFIHSQFEHKGYQRTNVSLRDIYDLYLISNRSKNSFKTITDQLPYRQKALNYFTLAERILGLNHRFLSRQAISQRTIGSFLFCLKFDSYLHYPFLARISPYISNRIYRRYVLNSLKFLFDKRERHRIIHRLKNYI